MHSKNSPHGSEQGAQLWHTATGTGAVAAAAAIVLLAFWTPEAVDVTSAQPAFPSTASFSDPGAGGTGADARRIQAERLAAEHDAFLRQAHGTANLLRPDEPFPLQFWP